MVEVYERKKNLLIHSQHIIYTLKKLFSSLRSRERNKRREEAITTTWSRFSFSRSVDTKSQLRRPRIPKRKTTHRRRRRRLNVLSLAFNDFMATSVSFRIEFLHPSPLPASLSRSIPILNSLVVNSSTLAREFSFCVRFSLHHHHHSACWLCWDEKKSSLHGAEISRCRARLFARKRSALICTVLLLVRSWGLFNIKIMGNIFFFSLFQLDRAACILILGFDEEFLCWKKKRFRANFDVTFDLHKLCNSSVMEREKNAFSVPRFYSPHCVSARLGLKENICKFFGKISQSCWWRYDDLWWTWNGFELHCESFKYTLISLEFQTFSIFRLEIP